LNVPSFEFLAFAALVALAIHASDRPAWRRGVMILANIGFVLTFTHDPRALAPFAGLLAFGFASLKIMEFRRGKAAFVPLLLALIVGFFWLKRYAFVPHEMFLPFSYFVVGMSYVYFRMLHLVIDAYQDALPERIGLAAYVSFTLNFTCLVSGPIQMFQDYRRTETGQPLPLTWQLAGDGLARIVVGFFKVSIVSPVLLYAQREAIVALASTPGSFGRVIDGGLVLTLFPVYVYYNFSGYTDFVIGAAKFLGLSLPENFNKPFFAQGVIDFWGRWHITLSNWLKTYVYSPLVLSLMRRIPSLKLQAYVAVFAYFVTFFLVGAWHGQSTKFLFFGLLTGFGISVNKLYEVVMARKLGRKRYGALNARPLYAAFARGLNFTWFSFTMLWFWSDWPQLGKIASLLGGASIPLILVCVIAAAALALAGLERLSRGLERLTFPSLRVAWYTALAVTTLSVEVVLNSPAPHLVYRAF